MDARLSSPSTERNRAPLAEILSRVLPASGTLLEVASGTGEHAVHLAPLFPQLAWQPSDIDPSSLASIAAWREAMPSSNLLPPVRIDVLDRPWPIRRADVVLAVNLIHISPWETTLELMAGAGEILEPSGALVTYGAYRIDGRHTAPSNETFDAWLKVRDARHGVRDLEAVVAAARDAGLELTERIPMPANNFTLVFRRR